VDIPVDQALRRPSAGAMIFDYKSLKDATVTNSGHGAQVGSAKLQWWPVMRVLSGVSDGFTCMRKQLLTCMLA
jgi:hypothetical protein